MYIFIWGCVVFVLCVATLVLDIMLRLKGKNNADKQSKL